MQIKTNISPFSFEKETVTCCSPGSLHDLRKKHSNFKLSSKPSKIKISTEFMEVAESSFIQQIQDKDINKELYRKYEEDFRKIIVDNEGNYIYTKVSKDLPKELSNLSIKIDRTLGVQEYTSFIDKKLLELENDKCDIKELNEKPKFFIRKSLKTTDSSTKKRKVPRDFINSLKEGAYQKMNEFINLKNKQDVIQSSKNEITAIVREYTLSIEKLTKEKSKKK